MVDFNKKKVEFKDLDPGDQFRVKIGRVLADVMQAAMAISSADQFKALDAHKRAEVLTSLTIRFVYEVENVIRSFAPEGGE